MTPALVRRQLLELVERGDRDAAMAVMQGAREEGVGDQELIREVFAPLLAEVGERWLRNHWSVAQEHAATSVIDSLLGVLELEPASVLGTAGTVVAVCATGEWHVTPLRMFSELLRREGWTVRVLGASVPPDHLRSYLELQRAATAVVVSCSVPRFLPGAAALVAAAHLAGLPALVGGAAFGSDGRRSATIGADGWAGDAEAAAALLSAWIPTPPKVVPADGRVLAPRVGPLAPRIARVLAALSPPSAVTGLGTVEDLAGEVLLALDAAVALDDPSILVEELAWAEEAVRIRSPEGALVADVVSAVLLSEAPPPAIREALASVRRSPSPT